MTEELKRAAQATPEPDDAQRRFEAGCVVLEYLRDIGAPYRAVHHMLIALHGDPEAKSKATPEPVGEVFGYFRALPFGWEQCGEHDDGAVALYDRPAPGVPEGFALVPVEPTAAMLHCIVYDQYPQDADEGRKLQRKQLGEPNSEDHVPFKTEFELAVGQYKRLLAAAQAKGDDK